MPSAPFVVVNMAAGVTPMAVSQFLAGTALGSVPKIALVAYAGDSAIHALNGGGPSRWIKLAALAAVWIGMALVARAWLKREEARRQTSAAQSAGRGTEAAAVNSKSLSRSPVE